MKQVKDYSSLDLSRDSSIASALLDQVEVEARQTSVPVTSARQTFNARQPGNLTPAMSAWYSQYIAGPRVAAIGELSSAFEADPSVSGSTNSIFLEAERDKAKTKSLFAGIEQATKFSEKHGQDLDDYESCRRNFDTLRAELGDRSVVRTRTWLYALCLLGVVLLEAFINFESFLKVPYITSPFLATGATIAVGLGVGLAAHFHGIVLRQWNFLSSPQVAAEYGLRGRKQDAVRRLIAGAVVLLVALTMVAGSRYYYLRDVILQAEILGGERPSLMGGIGFMVLGNIIAYGIGLFIAYNMHDPHPVYAERDRELRKATARRDALKRSREDALGELRVGMENDLKRCSNQDQSARGLRYGELRAAADAVVNKDQEVIGTLLAYRNALMAALGARSAAAMFRQPEGAHDRLLPTSPDVVLSGEEYAGLPLTLGFTVS